MNHRINPRVRRGLVIALAFLLLAGLGLAQSLEDKVREFDLDNGMKFLVVERHEAPVVLGAIVFNVGSANEWPNVTGISHLLEHMMFKGTKMVGTTDYEKEIPYIRKTDELGEQTILLRKEIGEWRFVRFQDFGKEVITGFTDEEKERIGTSRYEQNRLLAEKVRAMDPLPESLTAVPFLVEDEGVNYLEKYLAYEVAWGEIARILDEQREYMVKDELWETYMNNGSRFLNAGTSTDFTMYFAYIPANRLELWMVLESDRMDTPIFREFWSERDVVMEERRLGENDPDDVLSEAFHSVAFTASPYNWPVVGWMSDLQTIDRQELADYHRTYYAPNNATAVVVGDIDADQVRQMAEKYFGPIPAQAPPPPVETREPDQRGERRVTVEHTANPKLMMGFHKPTFPHPDNLVFQVMQSLLTGGRTSRLYTSIFEEQQLTAEAPRVYAGPGQRYDNLLMIEAEPRHPHTLEEVEKAILAEMDKLKTEQVTDRELQRIKNQIDAQRIRQMGSNIGIAFQLAIGQLYLGDYRAMFRMSDQLKKVKAEDIQRVASQYLIPQNRTVGYRIKIEEKTGAEGPTEEQKAMREAMMKYIQTLSPEEQMAIFQKFQQAGKDPAAREAFIKELVERARAAGFIKSEEKKEE
ncbi:MAG: insulinase family protein [Acidobacteria bacterium]|nr:insulinase family protein [Acidobacteriota bacterium]